MAERVQLKDPGSELIMSVRSVKPETVEKNDYYLFTNGQKELLVPQSTVKGRLDHLEIRTVDEMVGQVVRFSRSMKMSRANKPYWDIDWAGGAEAPSQSAGGESGKPTTGTSASAPSADPASAKKPTMREAYKQLTEWVISDIGPLYHDASFDSSVVASITATLFIQACKAGKVD